MTAPPYQYVINEEEDEDGLEKEDRDKVLILFLPILIQLIGNRMFDTTSMLRDREIDFLQWSGRVQAIIKDAHETAYAMGMVKAGLIASTEVQTKAAEAIVLEQQEFFESLQRDIVDGRYTNPDGSIRTDPINTRLFNYSKRIRGTANRAWFDNIPFTTLVMWQLGQKEHCQPTQGFDFTCPELAARGFISKSAMPTVPGECKTPCYFNCGCEIVTRDGQTSF